MMIRDDLTRYTDLKKAEHLHDIYRQDVKAQDCANEAHFLAVSIRAQANAALAPLGVTLAMLEQAELA